MSAGDLTTLANVKAYVGQTATTLDAVYSRLIRAASSQILGYCSRYSFFPATVTETRDGTDTQMFVCKYWPVLSVSSVYIGSSLVPQAAPATSQNYTQATEGQPSGWYLHPYDGFPPGEPQAIEVSGYRFWSGRQNISVTYRFGYQSVDTIASLGSTTYAAAALQGSWGSDAGVVYTATGAALTAVQSAPGLGQYSVNGGVYTFSAADVAAHAALTVTYGFVPPDLEQACIELVIYKQTLAQRVGIRSKSLGGQETVSFDTSGIPDYIAAALQPYVSVLLVP